jgi:hypothetical protein
VGSGATGVSAGGSTAGSGTVGGGAPSSVGPSNLAGPPGIGIATGNGAPSAAATNGAASGASGSAAGSGGWSWGGFMAASPREEMPRAYQLRAVYFRRDLFKSTADCLTAAHSQQLPLDLCR